MFLSQIRLTNILSFKDAGLELGPLNVLIGSNASGKSNLLACLGLLNAAPSDLNSYILNEGGVYSWINKARDRASAVAGVECRFQTQFDLRYQLNFVAAQQSLVIERELVEDPQRGVSYIDRTPSSVGVMGKGMVDPKLVSPSESVFSRFKSPLDTPVLQQLGDELRNCVIYREFDTGTVSPVRTGVALGGQKQFLASRGQNLALVLNEMDVNESLPTVVRHLKRFCDRYRGVKVAPVGSVLQTLVVEEGLAEPVPAARLSDGTLKFLCLLAVLCNPRPPALVCIEEPEVGLHPDAVRVLAEVLREQSGTTQLIITTHSDVLVNALSDEPEAVVVCEHSVEAGSTFHRLQRSELERWLERYSLAEIWQKGIIGGNPW